MLDADYGMRILALDDDGVPFGFLDGLRYHIDPSLDPVYHHPDLDDDATCGCLLALVRKAWGPDCRVEVWLHGDGTAGVYVHRLDLVFGEEHCSLGLALAAALLAAPPKAGEP